MLFEPLTVQMPPYKVTLNTFPLLRLLYSSCQHFFFRTVVEFPGKIFFPEKMKIRNFQIENKLSKVKIKKIQMPLFRKLSFGVLNPLAYILVVLTLICIIIVRFSEFVFWLIMLFEKMEH